MADNGHEVTVLTTKHKTYEKLDSVFFPNVNIIRVKKLFKLKKTMLFFHPLIFYKKYDIVHAFTFFTFSSTLAILVNAKKKFLRSEILDSKQKNCQKAKSGIYKALILFYKIFYRKVYGYSNEEVSILKNLGFPNQNVFSLSPMIDQKVFTKILRKSPVDYPYLVIGTLARISPEKGLHKLSGIFKNLKRLIGEKFEFILAGRIDNDVYGNYVLAELKALLGDKFKYLGELVSPVTFYNQVDMVIIPSVELETGAIVTLESLAAGKVVVANNIYPMNIYIRDFLNGFLYNNACDAADKIAILMIKPHLLEFLSFNAQKGAVEYYSSYVCAKLEREYLKVLGK